MLFSTTAARVYGLGQRVTSRTPPPAAAERSSCDPRRRPRRQRVGAIICIYTCGETLCFQIGKRTHSVACQPYASSLIWMFAEMRPPMTLFLKENADFVITSSASRCMSRNCCGAAIVWWCAANDVADFMQYCFTYIGEEMEPREMNFCKV